MIAGCVGQAIAAGMWNARAHTVSSSKGVGKVGGSPSYDVVNDREETAMTEKKFFALLAIITTMGIQAATSATAFAQDNGRNSGKPRGGWVVPCSLDGVNPVYHPSIFGNAAVAAS
jgi:hypothetical protein